MDQYDGELNRRLGCPCSALLPPPQPSPYSEVTLGEIETQMGFPRDYLDFTTWYLLRKGYITRADNSDFTLTVDGVDFVETQRVNMPVLNKMLTNGTGSTVAGSTSAKENETVADLAERDVQASPAAGAAAAKAGGQRTILLPDMSVRVDRRSGRPDLRANKTERRVSGPIYRPAINIAQKTRHDFTSSLF